MLNSKPFNSSIVKYGGKISNSVPTFLTTTALQVRLSNYIVITSNTFANNTGFPSTTGDKTIGLDITIDMHIGAAPVEISSNIFKDHSGSLN